MKKILLLIAASAVIATAIGCSNQADKTPIARIPGVSKGVAVVDGQTVTNKEYMSLLHEQYGKQALIALSQEKILEAWAKELNVYPTKEEIAKETQKIKDEGQYEEAIAQIGQYGIDKMILDQLIKTNISKKITPPTDKELKDAYTQFKSEYVHGPRKLAQIIVAQDKKSLEDVYSKISAVKSDEEYDKITKELKNENIKSGALWIGKETQGAPSEIIKAVEKMKTGDVSNVGVIKGQGKNPGIYYILRIKKEETAIDKKFDEVKDDLANKVALMNSMMKEDYSKKLEERVKNAKIEINIDKYKDIVDEIKNPKPQMPMMSAPPQQP